MFEEMPAIWLDPMRAIWRERGLDIRNNIIREVPNGRWLDQKVTPDVLSAVCDAIAVHVAEQDHAAKKSRNDGGARVFTVKELLGSKELVRIVEQDFGKPHPLNPGSQKEYDKFVGHPLNTLAVARVLDVAKRRSKTFSVAAGMGGVIGQMAGSERKSVEFLDAYIYETILQSGMHHAFGAFFEVQNHGAFVRLNSEYRRFIFENTGIKRKYECSRIFPKVLNVLAYSRRAKGTVRGRLSDHPIGLLDIRYNRLNFRDKAKGKPKNVPRQHYGMPLELLPPKGGGKLSRSARRVIDDVKKHHKNRPEIQDKFSATPNSARGVEGHHIFPRSEYPNLSLLRENIILLTPTQHKGHAHADSSHAVSAYYQHFCLQKKLRAVQECQNDPNCQFYSFDIFKGMLFEAGVINASHGVANAKKLTALLPDDVERIMHEHYGAE